MRPVWPLDVGQETCIILRMYEAERHKVEDSAVREANPDDKQKGAPWAKP